MLSGKSAKTSDVCGQQDIPTIKKAGYRPPSDIKFRSKFDVKAENTSKVKGMGFGIDEALSPDRAKAARQYGLRAPANTNTKVWRIYRDREPRH